MENIVGPNIVVFITDLTWSCLCYHFTRMKKVFLRHVFAVGMHHHGSRQLEVDEGHTLKHEMDNPYDLNAISIWNLEGQKVAYLRRDCAAKVAPLFRQDLIQGPVYLKAKFPAEVFNRRQGPRQTCAVAFRCHDAELPRVNAAMANTGISVTSK